MANPAGATWDRVRRFMALLGLIVAVSVVTTGCWIFGGSAKDGEVNLISMDDSDLAATVTAIASATAEAEAIAAAEAEAEAAAEAARQEEEARQQEEFVSTFGAPQGDDPDELASGDLDVDPNEGETGLGGGEGSDDLSGLLDDADELADSGEAHENDGPLDEWRSSTEIYDFGAAEAFVGEGEGEGIYFDAAMISGARATILELDEAQLVRLVNGPDAPLTVGRPGVLTANPPAVIGPGDFLLVELDIRDLGAVVESEFDVKIGLAVAGDQNLGPPPGIDSSPLVGSQWQYLVDLAPSLRFWSTEVSAGIPVDRYTYAIAWADLDASMLGMLVPLPEIGDGAPTAWAFSEYTSGGPADLPVDSIAGFVRTDLLSIAELLEPDEFELFVELSEQLDQDFDGPVDGSRTRVELPAGEEEPARIEAEFDASLITLRGALGDRGALMGQLHVASLQQFGAAQCQAAVDASLVPVIDFELLGPPSEIDLGPGLTGLEAVLRLLYDQAPSQDAPFLFAPQDGTYRPFVNCGGG